MDIDTVLIDFLTKNPVLTAVLILLLGERGLYLYRSRNGYVFRDMEVTLKNLRDRLDDVTKITNELNNKLYIFNNSISDFKIRLEVVEAKLRNQSKSS